MKKNWRFCKTPTCEQEHFSRLFWDFFSLFGDFFPCFPPLVIYIFISTDYATENNQIAIGTENNESADATGNNWIATTTRNNQSADATVKLFWDSSRYTPPCALIGYPDVTIPNENHCNAFFSSTHRVSMKLSSLQRIITYSCGGQWELRVVV
jgi:hypothetical protein